MTAATGSVMGGAPKALEVAQRVVADEHHVAAATAIAAVGATTRDVGFAAKTGRAVTAGTGSHFNSCAIVQHQSQAFPARAERAALQLFSESTFTTLPRRPVVNCRVPAARA